MMPGYGSQGLRGKIEISSKGYVRTQNSIKTLSFPATLGVTPQGVIDSIASCGRQKYQFTPEWEGCRYWNQVVIQDLQTAGYIPAGSATTAQEALSYYWVYPKGQEARPIKEGRFQT